MPRAKRSRCTPGESESTSASDSESTKVVAMTSVSPQAFRQVNTTGLLALPVEVFARIQDELLAGSRLIRREDVLTGATHFPESSFQYRADLLRPLTQVCRVLRNVYFAEVYEHMESCIVRGKNQWWQYLGDRLERLSKRCERESAFAQRVRIVTVSLTRRSKDVVLPAFAEGLSHLPNLHTLRISFVPQHISLVLKNTFDGRHYPQVRTIIVPTWAHNILRACPNVVDVTCNGGDGNQLLNAMHSECRDVEVMEGFPFPKEAMMKSLPQSAPKLRKLTLGESVQLKDVPKLPYLSELVLKIHVYTSNNEHVETVLDEATKRHEWRIDPGLAVIRKSDVKTPKSFKLIYLVPEHGCTPQWIGVPWKAGRTISVPV